MSPAKPPLRDEVRYVLDALKSAIKILGFTVRDIENKLRYSHGYLSRVFAGTIELKMEHVIDVAKALEVDPEELLAFVYPTLKDPASPAAYELWQRVGGQPPVGTFVIRNVHKQSVTDEELERALRRTLGRVLGEVSGHLTQPLAEPAAEEAKPKKARKPSKKP
ncbi:MAG: helix-turn-helix transcriptional regulator [Thermoanaerobaculia bacterium]